MPCDRSSECAGGRVELRYDGQRARTVDERGCVRSCDHVAEWYTSDDVWQDVGVTEGVRRDVEKAVRNDQERSK